MRSVWAIRHVAFEDMGILGEILNKHGVEVQYFEAGVDDLSKINASSPDLLVVLGGPIGAYEESIYPFVSDEITLIKQRLDESLPVLGICLGAQMMARALGASVYPGPAKEIGWTPLTLTESAKKGPLAHLEGSATSMLHWHGDTFDLPEGATLLASTPLCKNQVFSWGENALAFQCHPEIKTKNLERWYIGHACELSANKTSVTDLRKESLELCPILEKQGAKFFSEWLSTTLGLPINKPR